MTTKAHAAKNTRSRARTCTRQRVGPSSLRFPSSHQQNLAVLRQNAADPSYPVEGGCANDYTYVHGDPINTADLSGQVSCKNHSYSNDYARMGIVDKGHGNYEYTFQLWGWSHPGLTTLEAARVDISVTGHMTNMTYATGHSRPITDIFHANIKLQGASYRYANTGKSKKYTVKKGDVITFHVYSSQTGPKAWGTSDGWLTCTL